MDSHSKQFETWYYIIHEGRRARVRIVLGDVRKYGAYRIKWHTLEYMRDEPTRLKGKPRKKRTKATAPPKLTGRTALFLQLINVEIMRHKTLNI